MSVCLPHTIGELEAGDMTWYDTGDGQKTWTIPKKREGELHLARSSYQTTLRHSKAMKGKCREALSVVISSWEPWAVVTQSQRSEDPACGWAVPRVSGASRRLLHPDWAGTSPDLSSETGQLLLASATLQAPQRGSPGLPSRSSQADRPCR